MLLQKLCQLQWKKDQFIISFPMLMASTSSMRIETCNVRVWICVFLIPHFLITHTPDDETRSLTGNLTGYFEELCKQFSLPYSRTKVACHNQLIQFSEAGMDKWKTMWAFLFSDMLFLMVLVDRLLPAASISYKGSRNDETGVSSSSRKQATFAAIF